MCVCVFVCLCVCMFVCNKSKEAEIKSATVTCPFCANCLAVIQQLYSRVCLCPRLFACACVSVCLCFKCVRLCAYIHIHVCMCIVYVCVCVCTHKTGRKEGSMTNKIEPQILDMCMCRVCMCVCLCVYT